MPDLHMKQTPVNRDPSGFVPTIESALLAWALQMIGL